MLAPVMPEPTMTTSIKGGSCGDRRSAMPWSGGVCRYDIVGFWTGKPGSFARVHKVCKREMRRLSAYLVILSDPGANKRGGKGSARSEVEKLMCKDDGIYIPLLPLRKP